MRIRIPVGLLAGDLGWDQRDQLRLECIQFVQTRRDLSELVGERVDAVECVKQRSECPAHRNVEAVRFPVEVIAKRPEEVVEVSDLVAQIVNRGDGVVKRFGLFVGGGGGLLLQGILLAQNGERLVYLRGLFEYVGRAVLLVFQVLDLAEALRAELKRYRAVVERGAQRPRHGLHHGDTGGVEDRLGHPLQDEHVGRVTHIVIRLDHQQFGIQPGLSEVPLSSRVADNGRGVGRQVVARVVTRLVSRQGEQTNQGHGGCNHEDGSGPAHDSRADPPPSPGAHLAFRVERPEMTSHGQHRGGQGQGGHQRSKDAYCGRNSQAVKVRQPGKAEAVHRAGDRQARAQNNVRGPSVHRVERCLAIHAGVARLLITAQKKYHVVGSGGDGQ